MNNNETTITINTVANSSGVDEDITKVWDLNLKHYQV